MNWYLEVLKKYAVFTGRARRKEFWMFTLFNFIICIAISLAEMLVGSPGIIGILYVLAVFIPGIAVSVRRLHDTNRTGWWQLLALVPVIGWIFVIIFLAQDSQPGQNRYGDNPKEGIA